MRGAMGWGRVCAHLRLSSTAVTPAPWGANRSGELRWVKETGLCVCHEPIVSWGVRSCEM